MHHNCGSAHCSHVHDGEEARAAEFSLFSKIDLPNVECLNEVTNGSGATVFKPWHERFDVSKFVESDADDELLFKIPFTGSVRLRAMAVYAEEGPQHPACVRLYKNCPALTWDGLSKAPDQEILLAYNGRDIVERPLNRSYGTEKTRLSYIGLKGDFTEMQRQQVVITNYELKPNPADHAKTPGFNQFSQHIS